MPDRKWRSPARVFGCGFQHFEQPLVFNQTATKLERVLPRRVRHLIEKDFVGEDVLGRFHGAPRAGGNGRIDSAAQLLCVGNRIRYSGATKIAAPARSGLKKLMAPTDRIAI